jgi:hypothetical protein
MSFAVELTKDGLRRRRWENQEWLIEHHRPSSVPELLRFWGWQLTSVDADVTLGDLLALLRCVEGIESLGPMFSCDIGGFLAEAAEPCIEPSTGIDYLEVYNMTDQNHFDEEKEEFTPPYSISRGFHGWGPWEKSPCREDGGAPHYGGMAVEFSPVNAIAHLPLRYNPAVQFYAEHLGQDVAFETTITIDFGEFVFAIIWEIGFFGCPGDRNEKWSNLSGLADDVMTGKVETETMDIEDLLRGEDAD